MRHLCALAIATLLAFAAVTVPALAPTADAAELKVATVDFQRALDEGPHLLNVLMSRVFVFSPAVTHHVRSESAVWDLGADVHNELLFI